MLRFLTQGQIMLSNAIPCGWGWCGCLSPLVSFLSSLGSFIFRHVAFIFIQPTEMAAAQMLAILLSRKRYFYPGEIGLQQSANTDPTSLSAEPKQRCHQRLCAGEAPPTDLSFSVSVAVDCWQLGSLFPAAIKLSRWVINMQEQPKFVRVCVSSEKKKKKKEKNILSLTVIA